MQVAVFLLRKSSLTFPTSSSGGEIAERWAATAQPKQVGFARSHSPGTISAITFPPWIRRTRCLRGQSVIPSAYRPPDRQRKDARPMALNAKPLYEIHASALPTTSISQPRHTGQPNLHAPHFQYPRSSRNRPVVLCLLMPSSPNPLHPPRLLMFPLLERFWSLRLLAVGPHHPNPPRCPTVPLVAAARPFRMPTTVLPKGPQFLGLPIPYQPDSHAFPHITASPEGMQKTKAECPALNLYKGPQTPQNPSGTRKAKREKRTAVHKAEMTLEKAVLLEGGAVLENAVLAGGCCLAGFMGS